MAKTFFSPTAEKDFRRLPPSAKNALQNCIAGLNSNPYAGKPLHGPLRGFFVCRFNAGGASYRAAYEVIDSNVIILMIGNRDDFYKKFNRRAK